MSRPIEIPDLSGRVAIVTGSSRGIGKLVALALAEAGADIVVAAKSVHPKPGLPGTIHETAEEVEKLGRRALAVQTNVREASECKALVDATVEEFGRVDILVNNAGALWWKDVSDTPMRRFDLVMDVNARAAFALAHYCLPHMVDQEWGHIINMSPPIDPAMVPGKVAYSISKFGMTLIAMGLAGEVQDNNVACNALWPATLIESYATINFQLGTPKQWRKADIIADATLAIVGHEPRKMTGNAFIDEDLLRRLGVENFDRYLCVEDGDPLRIAGHGAVDSGFGSGAGGGTDATRPKS